MQEELQHFLGDTEFKKLNDYYLANRERFEAERMRAALVQIAV